MTGRNGGPPDKSWVCGMTGAVPMNGNGTTTGRVTRGWRRCIHARVVTSWTRRWTVYNSHPAVRKGKA